MIRDKEAPNKIYLIRNIPSNTSLNTCDDQHGKYLHEWYKTREKDIDIEYIRTDVVCKALQETMYEALMFQGRLHRDEVINNFINSFKEKLI